LASEVIALFCNFGKYQWLVGGEWTELEEEKNENVT
jgi:hypothetical protein